MNVNLPVLNAKSMQDTNDGRPYVHVCRECDFKNAPITDTPNEDPTQKGETRVSAVPTAGRQATKSKVPTTEELTLEHTKQVYCRNATTQVGVSK